MQLFTHGQWWSKSYIRRVKRQCGKKTIAVNSICLHCSTWMHLSENLSSLLPGKAAASYIYFTDQLEWHDNKDKWQAICFDAWLQLLWTRSHSRRKQGNWITVTIVQLQRSPDSRFSKADITVDHSSKKPIADSSADITHPHPPVCSQVSSTTQVKSLYSSQIIPSPVIPCVNYGCDLTLFLKMKLHLWEVFSLFLDFWEIQSCPSIWTVTQLPLYIHSMYLKWSNHDDFQL